MDFARRAKVSKLHKKGTPSKTTSLSKFMFSRSSNTCEKRDFCAMLYDPLCKINTLSIIWINKRPCVDLRPACATRACAKSWHAPTWFAHPSRSTIKLKRRWCLLKFPTIRISNEKLTAKQVRHFLTRNCAAVYLDFRWFSGPGPGPGWPCRRARVDCDQRWLGKCRLLMMRFVQWQFVLTVSRLGVVQ